MDEVCHLKNMAKKQRVGLHPYIDQQKPLFFETSKRFDRSAEKWVGNKIKKQQSSSKSVFISLSSNQMISTQFPINMFVAHSYLRSLTPPKKKIKKTKISPNEKNDGTGMYFPFGNLYLFQGFLLLNFRCIGA